MRTKAALLALLVTGCALVIVRTNPPHPEPARVPPPACSDAGPLTH